MLRCLIPSQVEECLNWWESGVKCRQEFWCLTCTDINGNKGPWGRIVDLGLYIIPINETGLVLHTCNSMLLFFSKQGLSWYTFHHFSTVLSFQGWCEQILQQAHAGQKLFARKISKKKKESSDLFQLVIK